MELDSRRSQVPDDESDEEDKVDWLIYARNTTQSSQKLRKNTKRPHLLDKRLE